MDLDGDFIPDIDIDSTGDGKADANLDHDEDGIADENIIEITEWSAETKIGNVCTMIVSKTPNDEEDPNQPDKEVEGSYYPGNNMGGALTADTTHITRYLGWCFVSIGMILFLIFKRNQSHIDQ